eukprot:2993726-Amphidinium_carterae.1
MRHEHVERLRRRGAALPPMQSTDELPVFDPAYPWEWVWAAAVSDRSFWHDELENPITDARTQGLLTPSQPSLPLDPVNHTPAQSQSRKRARP